VVGESFARRYWPDWDALGRHFRMAFHDSERLTFLRTPPSAADPQFLLARPKGGDMLLSSLRQTLCDAAEQVSIHAHLVPPQLRLLVTPRPCCVRVSAYRP